MQRLAVYLHAVVLGRSRLLATAGHAAQIEEWLDKIAHIGRKRRSYIVVAQIGIETVEERI
jgi:hypothetical protein